MSSADSADCRGEMEQADNLNAKSETPPNKHAIGFGKNGSTRSKTYAVLGQSVVGKHSRKKRKKEKELVKKYPDTHSTRPVLGEPDEIPEPRRTTVQPRGLGTQVKGASEPTSRRGPTTHRDVKP